MNWGWGWLGCSEEAGLKRGPYQRGHTADAGMVEGEEDGRVGDADLGKGRG